MADTIQKATSQLAKKQKTMKDYVESMKGEIAKALPNVMTPSQFVRNTITALSSNPELQNTTPQSFLGAMMTAAQLGLKVNTPLGEAYLLPYRNKGVLETQFQLGYKGLLNLAYRSGNISAVDAKVVYENDEFHYEFGLEPKLEHKPALKERGEPIAFYAIFKTKDGGFGFDVMSVEDVKIHAKKYSKSFNSAFSPWSTNFEEMAKKTVLKRVLKYAPLSTEVESQVTADETIKKDISTDMFEIANEPIEAEVTIVDSETGEITQN